MRATLTIALLFHFSLNVFAQDAAEIQALEDLAMQYDTLQQLGWGTNTDYCTWPGVGCNSNGNIENLILGHYFLGDTLPNSIGNLTFLKRMDIHKCGLTYLPASFGNLVNLEFLSLRLNDMPVIPAHIFQLPNLQTLDLSNMGLSSFPEQIEFAQENLTNLRLFENKITQFPSDLSSLANLESIDLDDNLIQEIPSSIQDLTNLQILSLQDNQINTIHDAISNLTNLEFLYLSNNQLNALPNDLGELSNLKRLLANGNALQELPSSITQLENLQWLYVQYNQLTSLPLGIADLSNLDRLSISFNQLDFSDLNEIKAIFDAVSIPVVYAPQDSIGLTQSELVHIGDTITLNCMNEMLNNQYQWFLMDSLINTTNACSLTIENINPQQLGEYSYHVTNLDFPQLTLFSRPITIYPRTLAVQEVQVEAVSCYEEADGAINVLASSDYPIKYNWQHTSSDTSFLMNLNGGIYQLQLTDSVGDSLFLEIELEEPDSLSVDIEIVGTTMDDAFGSINLAIQGGTAPYAVYLNGVLQEENFIENLSADVYELEVLDANDCSKLWTLEVPIISNINTNLTENVTFIAYPNPSNNVLHFNKKISFLDKIQLFNTSGIAFDVRFIDANTLDISHLSSGIYMISTQNKEGKQIVLGRFVKSDSL